MTFLGLLSGIISGMILFQTAVVASVVFTTLDSENASKFLRKIFPRFFLIIFFLGVVGLLISFLYNNIHGNTIYGITSLAMIISYLVVPATNKARDENKSNTFRRLHTVTVVLTLFTLLANLSWILPV
tara:strand:- start:1642 stop:2025 length:384 start_codon:yes stop_codon:yes gene_type:complete